MQKSWTKAEARRLPSCLRAFVLICLQGWIFESFVWAGLDGAEIFPESRFGAPPAGPSYGRRSGVAPMQAELRESESSAAGRGLASLDEHVSPRSKSRLKTGTQEVALIAGDLGFFPRTIFVTRDIPVKLFVTGASKKALCLMLDDFDVKKQLRSQRVEEVGFVPKKVGQFRFYCPINGAEGAIFVKEPGASSQTLGPVPMFPQELSLDAQELPAEISKR